MIDAEHSLVIDTGIDNVWDYVQDISNWALLFPGCKECEVIDENHSRWVIKVGAGGLVKTVNVLVHVPSWDGPERVDFTYKLESEPVVGSGSYIASKQGNNSTGVRLYLRVEGSGQMAPMWEAMSKPILPQMAKVFSDKLKEEIESQRGVALEAKPSIFGAFGVWLRNLWLAILGVDPNKATVEKTKRNVKTVLTFIDAMSEGDADKADPCVAADAFTVAKGYGKFSGVRQRDVMVGTISAFKQLLPSGLGAQVKSVTAQDERVVVEFEGNGTTCDGKEYKNQYCMVFTMADGKIKQVNEYFCNIHADEVLWPLVSEME